MKKILVIDDEPLIRTFLRATLEHAGYEVKEASDGNEGLHLLHTYSPDLIITDMIMPDKDGIELIMEIRKSESAIKLIAISGGGYIPAEKYLTLAKALNIDTCLQKPFDSQQIISAVKKCLNP
jgi:YesN/AraC family two-component response regulator